MNCIEARGLRKSYGATVALDGVDLSIPEGRIVGLIGLNGAGKTTALDAILGLTPYQGGLRVLGLDPWTQRDLLTLRSFPAGFASPRPSITWPASIPASIAAKPSASWRAPSSSRAPVSANSPKAWSPSFTSLS